MGSGGSNGNLIPNCEIVVELALCNMLTGPDLVHDLGLLISGPFLGF